MIEWRTLAVLIMIMALVSLKLSSIWCPLGVGGVAGEVGGGGGSGGSGTSGSRSRGVSLFKVEGEGEGRDGVDEVFAYGLNLFLGFAYGLMIEGLGGVIVLEGKVLALLLKV